MTRSAGVMRAPRWRAALPARAETSRLRRALPAPRRLQRNRLEPHLVAGRQHRRRITAQVPQGHGRAPDQVPAAGALQRVDGRQRGGDGDGAWRHLGARVLPARQRQLRRQVAHVGVARQEPHHVDVIGRGAVAFGDFVRRQPSAVGDLGHIGRQARIVARRHAPEAACALRCFEAAQQRTQSRLQLRLRKHARVVIDRQRTKRRHQLAEAGDIGRR